jgi:hypothetical protein
MGCAKNTVKPYVTQGDWRPPARPGAVVVRITYGEVQYAGTETLHTRDERLSELLARAGGVPAFGDASAARFSRRVLESKRVGQLVNRAGGRGLREGAARTRVGRRRWETRGQRTSLSRTARLTVANGCSGSSRSTLATAAVLVP